MWLINNQSLKLEEFIGENVPPYAILSHTWDDQEVTFHDLASPDIHHKKGYSKIVKTCKTAVERDSLQYSWVDTCCINKSSSSELSEAINSMFMCTYYWLSMIHAWYDPHCNRYRRADICYASLSDLENEDDNDTGFPKCRWFTRGWSTQTSLYIRKRANHCQHFKS
jgi:Heterokaryon incompatibility protein (HET)